MTRSLVFPGAGHAMLGYPIDGFARGVLFVLSVGLVIFLSIAALHTAADRCWRSCSCSALAVGVYVLSAVEIKAAGRSGGAAHGAVASCCCGSSVGLMFLVVGAIALSVATSTRR